MTNILRTPDDLKIYCEGEKTEQPLLIRNNKKSDGFNAHLILFFPDTLL